MRRGRVYGLVGGNDSGKSQGLRLGVSAGSVSEISFHDGQKLPEARCSERFMIAGSLASPLPGTWPKIVSAWGPVCTLLVLYRTVFIENWEQPALPFRFTKVVK